MPLRRKTPLRSNPTGNRNPVGERDNLSPRKPERRKPARDTGPTRESRKLVVERDAGRCVRCGRPVGESVGFNDHHRQGRGMGGARGPLVNSPANRLTLCGSGTTGCHGWVTVNPAEAERDGLVVRRGGGVDPTSVPVRTWAGWVLLDHDGGTIPCPPPQEGDARNALTG